MGKEGGVIDLNLGTPDPILSAIRLESPFPPTPLSPAEVATGSSSAAERRSE